MIEAKKLTTYNYNSKLDVNLCGFIDRNGRCILLYGKDEVRSLKELAHEEVGNPYRDTARKDRELTRETRFKHIYVGTGKLDDIAIIDMVDRYGETTMTSYGIHELDSYEGDKKPVGIYTIEHKFRGKTKVYALTDSIYSVKTIFENPYEDVLESLPYAQLQTPSDLWSNDILLIQNGIDFDIATQASPNPSYKVFTPQDGPKEFYIQEWQSILDENIWYYKINRMVLQQDPNKPIVNGHGGSIDNNLIPFLRKIKLLKPLDD